MFKYIVILVLSFLYICAYAAERSNIKIQQDAHDLVYPTAVETLCLEYMNRFRRNPARDAERILAGAQGGISGMHAQVDLEKCRRELQELKPTPPLVFDLHLLQSARNHARYMIQHNITTHDEIKGNEYFTGAKPFVRMRVAQYPGYPLMENAYLRPVSAWNSHRGFVIDWGPTADGMQVGRGHRMACISAMNREVGIAATAFDKDYFYATCHNFGSNPSVPRFLGGVFYDDKNKNNFYDLGEGVSGVQIKADSGETCQTWDSGAYTLALGHQRAVSVSVTYEGYTATFEYAPGKENIRCAGAVPRASDYNKVAVLIDDAAASKHMFAALDLYWKSRAYFRSQKQEQLILQNSAEQFQAFEKTQIDCLRVFSEGSESTFSKALNKALKRYDKSAVVVWFKDLKLAFPVYAETKSLIEHVRAGKGLRRGALSKQAKKVKRIIKKIKQSDIQCILQEQYLLLSRTTSQR